MTPDTTSVSQSVQTTNSATQSLCQPANHSLCWSNTTAESVFHQSVTESVCLFISKTSHTVQLSVNQSASDSIRNLTIQTDLPSVSLRQPVILYLVKWGLYCVNQSVGHSRLFTSQTASLSANKLAYQSNGSQSISLSVIILFTYQYLSAFINLL